MKSCAQETSYRDHSRVCSPDRFGVVERSTPHPFGHSQTTYANADDSEPIPSATAEEMLISKDRHYSYIETLTGMQAYSGWGNSVTEGEAEALAYVAETLGEFGHMQDLGLDLEQQRFRNYPATEIWDSRLFLTIDGQEREAPANAISGHREKIEEALRFDSDWALNDTGREPVEADGLALPLRSADEVLNLGQDEAQGCFDYLAVSADVFSEATSSGFGGQFGGPLPEQIVGGGE